MAKGSGGGGGRASGGRALREETRASAGAAVNAASSAVTRRENQLRRVNRLYGTTVDRTDAGRRRLARTERRTLEGLASARRNLDRALAALESTSG